MSVCEGEGNWGNEGGWEGGDGVGSFACAACLCSTYMDTVERWACQQIDTCRHVSIVANVWYGIFDNQKQGKCLQSTCI